MSSYFWDTTLAAEALLDLFDPGLERRNVLLHIRGAAREALPPPALVGEPRLDPAQGLRDRVVLLLESLESPVDLIEVPEHVVSQLGELAVHLGEPAVQLGEPVAHLAEPTVQLAAPPVHLAEPQEIGRASWRGREEVSG